MIRPARSDDWPAIAAVQQESPEASQWDPSGHDVHVAEVDGCVAGFLATRAVAADEIEVLNLAVAPRFRRRGIARSLLSGMLENFRGDVFLEVRESNTAARQLYQSIGFTEVNRRPDYYAEPSEASIVMKFHSC